MWRSGQIRTPPRHARPSSSGPHLLVRQRPLDVLHRAVVRAAEAAVDAPDQPVDRAAQLVVVARDGAAVVAQHDHHHDDAAPLRVALEQRLIDPREPSRHRQIGPERSRAARRDDDTPATMSFVGRNHAIARQAKPDTPNAVWLRYCIRMAPIVIVTGLTMRPIGWVAASIANDVEAASSVQPSAVQRRGEGGRHSLRQCHAIS